jgi:hypothetical protein
VRKLRLIELRQRVRARIRAGKLKSRTCRRCPYVFVARGEIVTTRALKRRRDVKHRLCGRCPARVLLKGLKEEGLQ